MYYEICFLGRKLPVDPDVIPDLFTETQEGVDEPEALRKLLDRYELVWVSSITEFSRH